MKKLKLIVVAVLGIVTMFSCSSNTITVETLLKEMADRESISQWPKTEYQTLQTSSYSRDSKTSKTAIEDSKFKPEKGRDWGRGWFENHDMANYIRTEKNGEIQENVMLDVKGPGAVVAIWATGGGDKGNFRVYVDGEVVMDKPVDEFGSYNKEVGKAFSFHAPEKAENPNWRGRNFILPIPYSKSCKITHYGSKGYYHIIYRKYKPDVRVESFNKNSLTKYAKEIKYYAKYLVVDAKPKGLAQIKTNKLLQPGEKISFDLKGEKLINFIKSKIKADNIEQALRSTVLSIEFDGKNKVWCPIGQFYGIGYKLRPHRSFYIKVDDNGVMESRWAMPFAKSAKVSLINYGNQNIELESFEVVSKNKKWTNNSLYFNACWWLEKNIETKLRRDANYATINGRGILVGDNLTLFNYFADWSGKNWWGEGDEKIYVDGEEFPSHFGTGTEDYYCYAWCRPQTFSSLIATQPSGDGNKTPGHTSNNRYRLLDAICFKKSLKFDMEIWHPWRGNMDYAPATFWYGDKEATCNIKPNIEMAKQAITEDLVKP